MRASCNSTFYKSDLAYSNLKGEGCRSKVKMRPHTTCNLIFISFDIVQKYTCKYQTYTRTYKQIIVTGYTYDCWTDESTIPEFSNDDVLLQSFFGAAVATIANLLEQPVSILLEPSFLYSACTKKMCRSMPPFSTGDLQKSTCYSQLNFC